MILYKYSKIIFYINLVSIIILTLRNFDIEYRLGCFNIFLKYSVNYNFFLSSLNNIDNFRKKVL